MFREEKRANQRHLTMLTSNLPAAPTAYVIEFQAFKNILTHTLWCEIFAWRERFRRARSLVLSQTLLLVVCAFLLLASESNYLMPPWKPRQRFSSWKVNKHNLEYVNLHGARILPRANLLRFAYLSRRILTKYRLNRHPISHRNLRFSLKTSSAVDLVLLCWEINGDVSFSLLDENVLWCFPTDRAKCFSHVSQDAKFFHYL